MSENETEARRVIVDNRQTPEGFEASEFIHTVLYFLNPFIYRATVQYYAADLKKGDPTQRWEFKPFKN